MMGLIFKDNNNSNNPSFKQNVYWLGYEEMLQRKDFHPEIFIFYPLDPNLIHTYFDNSILYSAPINAQNISFKAYIKDFFKPKKIQKLKNSIGQTIEHVWRPGLPPNNIASALNFDEYEKFSSLQTLKMFLNKLEELLLYIEPSKKNIKVYSHKMREYLIQLCTEVENIFQYYMQAVNYQKKEKEKEYKTNDYIKLLGPLFLKEYEILFKPFKNVIAPIRPFKNWDPKAPSKTLEWYCDYNLTKHCRSKYFEKSTFLNCLKALAANIILFCVRYSPYELLLSQNIINYLFEIRLVNVDYTSFYIPKINIQKIPGPGYFRLFEAHFYIEPWKIKKIII